MGTVSTTFREDTQEDLERRMKQYISAYKHPDYNTKIVYKGFFEDDKAWKAKVTRNTLEGDHD